MEKDKEDKKPLTTPADGRFIMREISVYLMGHLSFLLTIKRINKKSANSLFIAFRQIWRIAVLLEESQTPASWVIEILEHRKEQEKEARQELAEQIANAA